MASVRPGVELLSEENGNGALVEKHQFYRVSLRMWLSRGEAVVWSQPWGLIDHAEIGARTRRHSDTPPGARQRER